MKNFIKVYPFVVILLGVIGFTIVISLPGQEITLTAISGLLFGHGVGLLIARLVTNKA